MRNENRARYARAVLRREERVVRNENRPRSNPTLAGMGFRAFLGFLANVGVARERGVGETSQSPEIRYKSQPADPLSLYGLTGVGFVFRLFGEIVTPRGRGVGESR